jgi:chromosome segregation ATPase
VPPPKLHHAVVSQLREILGDRPVTEAELRSVTEQADGLSRLLVAQLEASERRLNELTATPDSSLRDVAHELQRVEELRPSLAEVRSLVADLEERARELRSNWLLHQADHPRSI